MDKNNREYKNEDITLFWIPKECVHAGTCFSELIEVFNPSRRPWVNMENGTTEQIVDIVNRCPTNALMFKWNDEEKNKIETSEKLVKGKTPWETKEKKPVSGASKFVIMENGPAVISGKFRIIGPDGDELKSMEMASFCRCGNSKSMPFCDGTHRSTGFEG